MEYCQNLEKKELKLKNLKIPVFSKKGLRGYIGK